MIILWQQEYYHVPVALTFTWYFLLDACNAGDVRVGPSTVTLWTRTCKPTTWHEKINLCKPLTTGSQKCGCRKAFPPIAVAVLPPFTLTKRADKVSTPKPLLCYIANCLGSCTSPRQCLWCLFASVTHKSSQIQCGFLISRAVLQINGWLYCRKATSLQGEFRGELNNCYWKWLGQY